MIVITGIKLPSHLYLSGLSKENCWIHPQKKGVFQIPSPSLFFFSKKFDCHLCNGRLVWFHTIRQRNKFSWLSLGREEEKKVWFVEEKKNYPLWNQFGMKDWTIHQAENLMNFDRQKLSHSLESPLTFKVFRERIGNSVKLYIILNIKETS